MAVPYTFGSATASIPLSQLDSNFATTITLGNTAVQLGNTITSLTGVSNVASATSLSLGSNGNTTAVTIDTSQKVGIGTTSPNRLLSLYATQPVFQITNVASGNTQGTIQYQVSGSTDFVLDNQGSGSGGVISFTQAGTERMRIDSSGNLLVGTTSAFQSGLVNISYNSASNVGITMKQTNANNSGTFLNFAQSGSTIGSISGNATNIQYNTSSDYRLKENIAPMTGALAKVALLKPVTYKWKVDGSDGEGFIAHELAEVCSHAVSGAKDAIDEDGNPKYQGIDTSFLVATLTAALQETKALIDTQAETINALTARIVALESK
jgi:hypothetical protein